MIFSSFSFSFIFSFFLRIICNVQKSLFHTISKPEEEGTGRYFSFLLEDSSKHSWKLPNSRYPLTSQSNNRNLEGSIFGWLVVMVFLPRHYGCSIQQDFHTTFSGRSQDFLRNYSGFCQDFLRNFSGLFKDFLRTFSGLSQEFIMTFPGLSQDFLRTFSGLSQDIFQDFLRTFSELSWDFLSAFSGLSQRYLRTFSGLSHEF